jgi:transposase
MARAKRARTNVKYTVNLSEAERAELQHLLRGGRVSARRLTRARVLLKADEGLTDEQVADAIDVGIATVHRIRQRCVEDGLEAALGERARRGAPPLLTGAAQAHLVAVACSTPPEGRLRWTLRLLADRVVELHLAERCSYETVRRVLKKTS